MRAGARLGLLVLCCAHAAAIAQDRGAAARLAPTVILISFDGWRWDYDTKAPAPHLRGLMARGVRAENLIPSFPSKTFPNHYTVVTGLYPGRHGVVANVPPIVGVTDEGWQLALRRTVADVAAGRLRPPRGQHGYDPMLMSMRDIFVGAGPAFKRGATVPAFENVHIYGALAEILRLTPAPNDGDPAVARSLLR